MAHVKPVIVTPISIDKLEYWLAGYDKDETKFLCEGFTNGFDVGFSKIIETNHLDNKPSAKAMPDVVSNYLTAEVNAGRIVGPLDKLNFPNYHVAPMGVVPKKTPGKFRIIHDLSSPRGESINDGIPTESSYVTYASIDDAVRLVKECGIGSFMAKTDIKKAYRIIPISPQQYHLFAINWQNSFYFDTCLQMGCSSSSQIFQRFSTALEWIAVNKLQISHMCHILDDFFMVNKEERICLQNLKKFTQVGGDEIGVPFEPDKTVLPAQVSTFMGYEIDSVKSELRLPVEKVEKCVEWLTELMHLKKTTLQQLQAITGLLNFACGAIVPGRAFSRRLIDLTRGLSKPFHRVRITQEVKRDIVVWIKFLKFYNGKSLFMEEMFIQPEAQRLVTDAAGQAGFGAVLGNHWFNGEFTIWWKDQNITLLELVPIVLATEAWGDSLRNKVINFHTDNAALVAILNKMSSKHQLTMILVRRLVFTSLSYNFLFRAHHIPGYKNTQADALSRFQVALFKRLHPSADQTPSKFPNLPESLTY